MKTIKKIKLTTLAINELELRQMSFLKGGYGDSDCDKYGDIRGCCGEDLCNCSSGDSSGKASSSDTISA